MATSGSFSVSAGNATLGQETITFSWTRSSYVQGTSPTSTISWSIASSVKGANWVRSSLTITINGSTVSGTSGTVTINHSSSGTGSFTAAMNLKGYTKRVGTVPQMNYEQSNNATFILDTLAIPATFITAPNFTDEEYPIIRVYNPSFLDLAVSIRCGEQETSYKALKGSSNASFGELINLTEEDRKILRRGITKGDSKTVYFSLRSQIDGQYYYNTASSILTLVNANPVINPTVRDFNSTTYNLTGDSTKIVRYMSEAKFTFNAEARKEATIDSKYVINGDVKYDDFTADSGLFTNPTSNTFYFGVTDSRGLKTQKAVMVDLIPYVKLTSSIALQNLTLLDELTFVVRGNYFNESFGAQDNYLTFKYHLRENGEDIGSFGFSPEVTYGDNTYEAEYTITGLHRDSSYTLTVEVGDALMKAESQADSISAVPIFDWGKYDFNHNTDVSFAHGKNIIGTRADGSTFRAMEPCNGSGNTVINWDSYDQESSDTEVYGNHVKIAAKNGVFINGREYSQNKILWSGASPLGQYHTATLSENISAQPHGVVLVFSLYQENPDTMRWEPKDVSIHSFFISKQEVASLPNAPHTFFMMINSGFSLIGSKYVYIDDKVLSGHATNTTNGTNNGFTYKNNNFVLRYVIGV